MILLIALLTVAVVVVAAAAVMGLITSWWLPRDLVEPELDEHTAREQTRPLGSVHVLRSAEDELASWPRVNDGTYLKVPRDAADRKEHDAQ